MVLPDLFIARSKLTPHGVSRASGGPARGWIVLMVLVFVWTGPAPEFASGQVARELLGQDELEVALERLGEAARSNPEDAETRYQLGLALHQSGQLQRSIEEHQHAIRLSPTRTEYYLALADVFRAANLTEEARTLLSRTSAAFPESIEVKVALADVLFQLGRIEEALREFQRASGIAEGSRLDAEGGWLTRAFIHRRIGEMHVHLIQFDEALAAFRNALDLAPDDVNLHLALGRLYLRRNRLEEALGAYRAALAGDPLNQSAHLGAAEASLRLGRFDASIAASREAIEIDPEHLGPHYLLAMALIRSGREEEGRAALAGYRGLEAEARVRDHREREIGSVYKAALAQVLNGGGPEAVRLLREGIEIYPDASELYLNLGVTLTSLERYEEAIEVFETMIDLQLGDDLLVRRSLAGVRASIGAIDR